MRTCIHCRSLATIFICVTLALVPSVSAQTDKAAVTGRVTDATGAVVGRVEITLIHENGLRRQTTTDTEGVFAIRQLPAGTVTITAAYFGFETLRLQNIVLASSEERAVSIQLRLAPANSAVTVLAPGMVASATAAGTKTETPLVEIPQAISVVSREQMDAQTPQNAAQALRYTSGVVAEQRGVNFLY